MVNIFEVGLLAALGAVSMWSVVVNLRLAAAHGLVWTGIDGAFPVDQMQYLAWVQDAARHLLVSDLFLARATPHDYLQPMVAISGGLTAAGMAPWLALLVWKPVAVTSIFFAVRAYAKRLLHTPGAQLAALALGLFAASYGALGDEWIPFMAWGYNFGLVATAATVGALLAYDRAYQRAGFTWLPAGLALLASWLHPWQGGLLILIVLGSELLLRGRSRGQRVKRPLLLPLSTLAAAALPLVYYAILARVDFAWGFGASVPQHQLALSTVLLPLVPLLALALPAYLRTPASFLATATRLWPLAALTFWALALNGVGAVPLHAWTGITIPLAVLAVQGAQNAGFWRLPGSRGVGLIAVLALTVPGTIQMMEPMSRFLAPATDNQNLITTSEQRAFSYLARDPKPGAVLSFISLGDAVPGETGRHTYVGDDRWSGPHYGVRERMTWEVLHGWIRGSAARKFVLGTRTRFVLAGCSSHANLERLLAPTPVTADRFGCVTVYEIG